MKLSPDEERQLGRLLLNIKNTDKALEMKNYIQHGQVSTYDHCRSVTRVSFFLNRRLHLGANEKALAVGAFLHDFYLYDWHIPGKSEGLHGYTHSECARRNAVREFKIGLLEQEIIRTHMWPLNLTKIPRCREAWIVCLADKFVSTRETLFLRG